MELMKVRRDYALDVGRFAFAFLVVTLHMQMFGGIYLLPLARCTVPFFYLLSGYYMYKPDETEFGFSILRNWKKWWKLYAVYVGLFFIISCLLKCFVQGNYFCWTYKDTLCLLLEGVCPFMDQVRHEGTVYGIMTLWFLYAGTWGMLLVYMFRRHVGAVRSLVWLSVLYIIVVGINYGAGERVVPRIFTAAFPALYLGAYIRSHEEAITKVFRSYKIIWIFTAILVSWIESFTFRGGYNEIYYSTMLFTAILFLSLKTSGFGQVSAISYVPVRCSLDIYVWHRLAYFLFCLVGLRLEGWASVVVFISVFFVSFAIRKSMEWQKCLTGC